MPVHQSKETLLSRAQKLVSIWPLLAAAFVLIAGGVTASTRITDNTSDIAALKARVDKIETALPGIEMDLAIIKQQGEDTGARVAHIESRVDEQDNRRRK